MNTKTIKQILAHHFMAEDMRNGMCRIYSAENDNTYKYERECTIKYALKCLSERYSQESGFRMTATKKQLF